MIQQAVLVGVVVLSSAVTAGCAAVGLIPLLAATAGTAAGAGVGYTLDGIAYRTFTATMEDMRRATAVSLKYMNIPVKKDEKTEDGRKIQAEAGDRKIFIELERLTTRTTRMRVTARHGMIFRDRATSGEIILQTESALDDLPAAVGGKNKDLPAAVGGKSKDLPAAVGGKNKPGGQVHEPTDRSRPGRARGAGPAPRPGPRPVENLGRHDGG